MISLDEEFLNEQMQIELIIILNKLGVDCSNLKATIKMCERIMVNKAMKDLYTEIENDEQEYSGLRAQIKEASK